MSESDRPVRMHRRRFLRDGAAALGVAAFAPTVLASEPQTPAEITLGAFSDPHFADREPAGTRHYRDSTAKLAECVRVMNEARPAFVICLGDIVDKGKTLAEETTYLERIKEVYRKCRSDRHHAIGNHDVATFTKAQFLAGSGMRAPHYSFDAGAFHFVVLDACYRKDGEPYAAGNYKWTESIIPPAELQWLARDLEQAGKPTVVFLHQRLDDDKNPHTVVNAADVRRTFEQAGRVRAVLNGHDHRGGYRKVGGIHYVTLRGMVEGPGAENNAFAIVRLSADGIEVRGFGKQPSRQLT